MPVSCYGPAQSALGVSSFCFVTLQFQGQSQVVGSSQRLVEAPCLLSSCGIMSSFDI